MTTYDMIMCPVCGEYPVLEDIEFTNDYKASCSCGLACIGKGKEGAVLCWNHTLMREHPAVPFETESVEVEG